MSTAIEVHFVMLPPNPDGDGGSPALFACTYNDCMQTFTNNQLTTHASVAHNAGIITVDNQSWMRSPFYIPLVDEDTDWGMLKLRMEEKMAQARWMEAHPLNLDRPKIENDIEDEPKEETLWDIVKYLIWKVYDERFFVLMLIIIAWLVWKVFWPK